MRTSVRTDTDLFVYDTLTDPDRVASLLPNFEFRGSAVVDGRRRVDRDYPTLTPGGNTEGRRLRLHELDRLDAHESVVTDYPSASLCHADDGTSSGTLAIRTD